ncbi:hypothetical protein C8A01DRAFT_46748 [Parachaetomium inaequale]|uniref:Uncharacterized protein n=1 Tax=Parachaetomium inaequale TaxID=2588326 RepID=A0AAN6PFV4_9PEZI|nr:hypothetical protein C8A01DRAFT_46748 [Parachaetomium inaequale]
MDSESSGSSDGSPSPPAITAGHVGVYPYPLPESPVEEVPPIHQGRRIEVDGAFVQFLIDYAANDPECPLLFKEYLEDVVLKPGPVDLRRKVERHLRNPQIRDYGLGPIFLQEFEKYKMYDNVYPGPGRHATLGYAPIPEEFQPLEPLTPEQLSGSETVFQPPEVVDLSLDSDVDEELDETGNETVDRTGPDWEADSWYKGRLQPPLAARLDTVVKFLAEEDVDRCMDWETKLEKIVSYLEWLAHDDDMDQLEAASPRTQAMFNDAVTKAKAHVLFEKHHYDPTPLEITKPRKNPLRSTRLNWMINGQDWPLPSRNPAPDRSNLLPRPIPSRPPNPVNDMLVTRPVDRRLQEKLVEDEEEWWQRVADADLEDIPSDAEDDLERDNLAYIEDESFNTFSRDGQTGWIRTDPSTGETTLPDGAELSPGNPHSWATERGARRAGLQQMLRAFPTNRPPNTPRRRLVFPTPAAKLRKACESADGPQWTPPSLNASELPPAEQLETMPNTVSYRERLKNIKKMRELARLRVEDENASNPRWVTLPRNVANGGPFVWRMVDPATQASQDLLKKCRTAVKVLEAASRRVPRPLLEAVLGLVQRGVRGEFLDSSVPDGVALAGDEWEQVGHETLPRYLDPEEIEWLKFLAGECVNDKNWTGRFVPDTPRDKYRLFLLFATKVQKLLDDKNPQGLFSQHNANVEVEDLLKAINAGKDSSAVTKHEFQPYDACSWLDRMKQSGHVRFHLDPACYGIVGRPVAEYFPEHRVLWPAKDDSRERPSYYLGYISDWGSIIREGEEPDINPGSTIWNFFLSLAFRLGYTIAMLEQEQAASRTQQQPVPTRHLRNSINKWARASARLQTTDREPTAGELALLRTRLIDELHENKIMLAPGRKHHYLDRNGTRHTALVRDHNWDWASLAVRGGGGQPSPPSKDKTKPPGAKPRRHQFWSVNRWPIDTDHLSERAERAVKTDADLNPAMTYDPAAADPTDPRYMRPKLKPYRHEKVVYRPGPAVYPVGDTRLQRGVLRERMVEMVGRAIGLDGEEGTWGDTLARLNPFSRPSSRAEDREEDAKLPPVKVKAIPKSWDPVAAAERQDAEEVESDYGSEEEEMDDEDEVQSVDVAMTGMDEPWMTA